MEDADAAALHRVIARLQQSANSLEHELVQRRKADRALDLQAERISALERTQAVLKNLAGHDALTGLANRRAFTDRLAHAFARARRSGSRLALLFVDLDGFKTLNDRHGHEAGDRLLTQVAERLLRCVRASDTVCRLGGDEFTVLMEDADAAEATLLAQRVVDAFADRFVLGNDRVELTASVGIGRYPDDAADARGLMRSADRAMYRAKSFGKGRHASLDMLPPASPGATGDAPIAGRAAAVDASKWMTVEAAALQLGLSRPHVVKLIGEQRFVGQVMHQAGALPLISSNAVSRIAEGLAHA